MTDVYYKGDLGDLGNVDWFNADSNQLIPDVGSVTVRTLTSTYDQRLTVKIIYAKGMQVLEGDIVRDPSCHKYVGQTATPKFTVDDIGEVFWWDRDYGRSWEKVRLVELTQRPGAIAPTHYVTIVTLANSDRYVTSTKNLHRSAEGAPRPRTEADVAESHADEEEPSEGDRLADFFRGKPTW